MNVWRFSEVRAYASSTFLSSGPDVNLFTNISAAELGLEKISRSCKVFFLFVISSSLVWWCLLPLFTSLCKFSFSQSVLILSWFWKFYSFCYLSYYILRAAHFSTPNSILFFWLSIRTFSIRVYISFSFFANILVINLFFYKVCNGSGERESPWKKPLSVFVALNYIIVHR